MLVSALLVAGAAPGCGSSNADPAGTSASTEASTEAPTPHTEVKTISLSKNQFITRAEGVCRRSWADMLSDLDYGSELGPNATKQERFASSSRHVLLPSIQMQFDDIKYIGAPKGEKATVETILRILQLAVYNAEEKTVSSAKRLTALFSAFNRSASQYGLHRCLVNEARFK